MRDSSTASSISTTPLHFDPAILLTFRECHKQFEEIYEAHKD
jgi:hypothetical protein